MKRGNELTIQGCFSSFRVSHLSFIIILSTVNQKKTKFSMSEINSQIPHGIFQCPSRLPLVT